MGRGQAPCAYAQPAQRAKCWLLLKIAPLESKVHVESVSRYYWALSSYFTVQYESSGIFGTAKHLFTLQCSMKVQEFLAQLIKHLFLRP